MGNEYGVRAALATYGFAEARLEKPKPMEYAVSRVFTSEITGAAIYVFSHDHCPPHVHARHRGDGWIARVAFSYVGLANQWAVMPTLGKIELASADVPSARQIANASHDPDRERLLVTFKNGTTADVSTP